MAAPSSQTATAAAKTRRWRHSISSIDGDAEDSRNGSTSRWSASLVAKLLVGNRTFIAQPFGAQPFGPALRSAPYTRKWATKEGARRAVAAALIVTTIYYPNTPKLQHGVRYMPLSRTALYYPTTPSDLHDYLLSQFHMHSRILMSGFLPYQQS